MTDETATRHRERLYPFRVTTKIAIGAALLFVGLVVGFMPVSKGGVSCGSAWHASDDASISDLSSTLGGGGSVTHTADDCDSLRSVLRIPSVAALLLGGVVLFAVYLGRPARR